MPNHEVKYISEPQAKYIRDLSEKKNLTQLSQEQQVFLAKLLTTDGAMSGLTSKQASNIIKALLDLPDKPKPPPPAPAPATSAGHQEDDPTTQSEPIKLTTQSESGVREGYFFIVDPTDGKEKFFRVKHGKEGGRWQGYVFLDVQASDFLYPVRNKEHKEAVFAEIMKDPITAMNEYGMRLGRCGVCGRTLTDRDSRLRGIGPICAAKLQPTSEQMDIIDIIRNKKYNKE